MKAQSKGVLLVALASALFSLGGLFIKLIPWTALSINAGRCFFSSLIIFVYMCIRKRKVVFSKTVFAGASAVFLMISLYMFANKLTTAANAIVLQYTAPVFIIFFMWILYKQKPKKLDVLAICCVLCGIVFFFVDGIRGGGTLGNLLAICSGVTYAVVCMLNAMLKEDALSAIFLGHFACFLLGVPFMVQESVFNFHILIYIVVLGVFQLGIAYILFSEGLKTTPPVTACLISAIEPILNPIWVAIFYGEKMSTVALIGAAIVIASIAGYNVLKVKSERLA